MEIATLTQPRSPEPAVLGANTSFCIFQVKMSMALVIFLSPNQQWCPVIWPRAPKRVTGVHTLILGLRFYSLESSQDCDLQKSQSASRLTCSPLLQVKQRRRDVSRDAQLVGWRRETGITLKIFCLFSHKSHSLIWSIFVNLNIQEGPASKQQPRFEAQKRESFIDFFSPCTHSFLQQPFFDE